MADENVVVIEVERRVLASIASHPEKILRTYEALGSNVNRLTLDTHRDVLAALVHLAVSRRPATLSAVAHGFATRGKGEKRYVAAAARARDMIAYAEPELDLEAELRFLGTTYGYRDARRDRPDPSAFEAKLATLGDYATAVEDYARRLRDASATLSPLATQELAVHLDDALTEAFEDDSSDWLVEDLIGKTSVGMIAGPPTSGKSTLIVQLALCLAHGITFIGRKITDPKRTLYLIAEGSRAQFVTRVGVAARTLGLTQPYGPWFMQATRAEVFDIGKPGFEGVIANAKPDLVVLDTCYKFAPGVNENHADEWRARIYAPLAALSRKHNTTFLLIHHKGKGEKTGPDSVAGTYAQFGDTDFFMRLQPDDENGENLTLHLDKVRGRPKMTIPIVFDGARGVFATGHVARHSAQEQEMRAPILAAIIAAAEAFPDRTVPGRHVLERLRMTGYPQATESAVKTLVAEMIREGALERNESGWRVPAEQKDLGL